MRAHPIVPIDASDDAPGAAAAPATAPRRPTGRGRPLGRGRRRGRGRCGRRGRAASSSSASAQRVVERPVTERVALDPAATAPGLTGGIVDGVRPARSRPAWSASWPPASAAGHRRGAEVAGSGVVVRDDGIVVTSAAVVAAGACRVGAPARRPTAVAADVVGTDPRPASPCSTSPAAGTPPASSPLRERPGGRRDGHRAWPAGGHRHHHGRRGRRRRRALRGPAGTALDGVEVEGDAEASALGGPVVDDRGAVVGVTTAVADGEAWYVGAGRGGPTGWPTSCSSTASARHCWLGIEGTDAGRGRAPPPSGTLGGVGGPRQPGRPRRHPAGRRGRGARRRGGRRHGRPDRALRALLAGRPGRGDGRARRREPGHAADPPRRRSRCDRSPPERGRPRPSGARRQPAARRRSGGPARPRPPRAPTRPTPATPRAISWRRRGLSVAHGPASCASTHASSLDTAGVQPSRPQPVGGDHPGVQGVGHQLGRRGPEAPAEPPAQHAAGDPLGQRHLGRHADERPHLVAGDRALGRHVERPVEPPAAGEVDRGGHVVEVDELDRRLVGGLGHGGRRAQRPDQPVAVAGAGGPRRAQHGGRGPGMGLPPLGGQALDLGPLGRERRTPGWGGAGRPRSAARGCWPTRRRRWRSTARRRAGRPRRRRRRGPGGPRPRRRWRRSATRAPTWRGGAAPSACSRWGLTSSCRRSTRRDVDLGREVGHRAAGQPDDLGRPGPAATRRATRRPRGVSTPVITTLSMPLSLPPSAPAKPQTSRPGLGSPPGPVGDGPRLAGQCPL